MSVSSDFLLSIPVQVIAWRTVFEMTCNVSSGTLNLTHSLPSYRLDTLLRYAAYQPIQT